jgi:hypothetical protein
MTVSPIQPDDRPTLPSPAATNVNGSLTPNRPKPVIENSEYGAFARRVLWAYIRRIAAGDIESLTHMVSLADDINDAITRSVHGLRAAGYSWAEIGSRLGVTRQAAQQRWGRPGGGARQATTD